MDIEQISNKIRYFARFLSKKILEKEDEILFEENLVRNSELEVMQGILEEFEDFFDEIIFRRVDDI